MDRHISSAMFISEIPVRCMQNGEKSIKWINNLARHTTARDVIISLLPACHWANYSLYVHIDQKKHVLKDSTRIYKVVEKINQRKTYGRLLFEIVCNKRVRFADEIITRTVRQGQSILSEQLKENFEKHLIRQTNTKRSSLKVINKNLPHSSSESGISSISSADDLHGWTKPVLETLV